MLLHYINWNVNPEFANLFGISLHYYSFLFGIGLLISAILLGKIFEIEGISSNHLEKLVLYSFIGVFIGARLGHCLFYDPLFYLTHPVEMFLPVELIDGTYKFTGYRGLASHGGVIGIITALILYSWKTKESFIKTIDLVAVVAPLGGAFIRFGNLMNSEIIGIPTTISWAFIFERVDNVPRHPAQLYESFAYLLIFAILISIYLLKRKKIYTGFFVGMVLSLVFTARFFIEFIKEKQVSFEEQMQLDMGQILSIPFIMIGILLVINSITKGRLVKFQKI